MRHKKNLLTVFLILAAALHLTFYISAHRTGWFGIFFDHVTRGQDFFQIPNGAKAFLQGGTLVGHPPSGIMRYAECCGVNDNVYHPLFSLLIGIPLQTLQPWTAFMIWTGIHLLISIGILVYVWHAFRRHPLLVPALTLYLANSYHYYEIQHAQFHFLITAAFIVMFLELHRRGDNYLSGFLLAFSLLVKPVGFLYVIPLLLAGHWRTVGIGTGLFVASTLPLFAWAPGKYYVDNIIDAMGTVYPSYNLMALVRVFPEIHLTDITFIRNACAVALLVYQIWRKPPVPVILMLWSIFQLLFYSGVYHYYFAMTSGLILVALVTNSLKRSLTSVTAIVLLTLPSFPVLYFRLAGDPAILPQEHLAVAALYSCGAAILFAAALIGSQRTKHQSVVR